MAIPYRWTCHACKHGNAAGSDACAQCGAPAVASVAQIERAERARDTHNKWTIGQEWPGHIQVFDTAGVLCLLFVFYTFDPFDFELGYLLGLPLAGVCFAAAMIAKRIERRARILRLVAAEDAEEELALQRAAQRTAALRPPVQRGSGAPRAAR